MNFKENVLSQIDIATVEEIKIKKPKKYNVILFNDDFTSFEFVISLLVQVFGHSAESAIILTQVIHIEGSGVAGTYTYEIAEQKKIDTMELARANEFPLRVEVRSE